MAYALTSNRPLRPVPGSPIVKVELGPVTERSIRRYLARSEVGLTEGPYADRSSAIANFMQNLGFVDRDRPLQLTVLSLAYFLSPENSLARQTLIGVGSVDAPRLVGRTDHIHATEKDLVAGELLAHSRNEESEPNTVTVSAGEEVYLLFASILRQWGYHAQLGITGSIQEGMHSVMCVLDGEKRELISVGFPTHPETKRLLILDDREAGGVTHLLNALNRAKRLADLDEFDSVAAEQLALCSAELAAGRAVINHPMIEVIEGLRSPLVSLDSLGLAQA